MQHNNEFLIEFIVDDKFSKGIWQNSAGFIRRENNCNYLRLNDNLKLEFISSEDAKFLYQEGRINYFAINSNDNKKVKSFKKEFQILNDELILVNVK